MEDLFPCMPLKLEAASADPGVVGRSCGKHTGLAVVELGQVYPGQAFRSSVGLGLAMPRFPRLAGAELGWPQPRRVGLLVVASGPFDMPGGIASTGRVDQHALVLCSRESRA